MKFKYFSRMFCLLAGLSVAGCIDDKGNYDYLPEEQIAPGVISGLQEEMSVQFGETVPLEATVSGTEGKENLRYMWYVYAIPNRATRDTLGYGTKIDWTVSQKSGSYHLYFEVRDTVTDVCVNQYSTVTVGTPLTDSWLVMETENGMADLDVVTTEGKVMEDMVTYSIGHRLQGEAVRVTYQENHQHEWEQADGTTEVIKQNVLFVASQNDLNVFDAESMKFIKNTEDCFYETPGVLAFDNCLGDGASICMINNGKYYYSTSMSANVGKFAAPAFGPEGCPDYDLHADFLAAGQLAVFWDKISRSFMWIRGGNAEFSVFANKPATGSGYGSPSNMNAELHHLVSNGKIYDTEVYNYIFRAYALMKGDDGKDYLATIRFANNSTYPFAGYEELPADCQLGNADVIVGHSTASAMYFAVGDQLMLHEVNGKTSVADREWVAKEFGGEEITYLRHVFSTTQGFDYLAVLTYKDGNWKLYALPFEGGGYLIDADEALENYLVATGKGRATYVTRLKGGYEY